MDNKALLDELMGKDRNLMPHERKRSDKTFSDPEVCKYHICGFCPHDLFVNTKGHLGTCPNEHNDECRDEFLAHPRKSSYPFEAEWIAYLESLVNDIDSKIRRRHQRLDAPDLPPVLLNDDAQERIDVLQARITVLQQQAEELGELGQLDEAQAHLRTADELKLEKERMVVAHSNTEARSVAQQEKRMKVCDICGAFLVVGDTERQTQNHLEGKPHMGAYAMRQAIEDYRKARSSGPGSASSSSSLASPGASSDRARDSDRRRSDGYRDSNGSGYRDGGRSSYGSGRDRNGGGSGGRDSYGGSGRDSYGGGRSYGGGDRGGYNGGDRDSHSGGRDAYGSRSGGGRDSYSSSSSGRERERERERERDPHRREEHASRERDRGDTRRRRSRSRSP